MIANETKRRSLEDFWQWFSAASAVIASDPTRQDILGELDRRIQGIDSRLSWEIGPGQKADWALTISPNLDPALASVTRLVVTHAPKVAGWEFNATRPPKQWNRKFDLVGNAGKHCVDASGWRFAMLKYPDGCLEVLVCSGPLAEVTEEQRQEMVHIVLESELGEETLLDPNLGFALVEHVEAELEPSLRPISEITRAFGLL